MSSTHEIDFGGHRLVLDASGALYWPSQRLLAVSDLHFEKATFLGRHGSFIAPYDTLDTLDRLEACMEHYQPRELMLLGDSFHDREAWLRLDDGLRARIHAFTARVEHCHWIEGNHDAALNGACLSAFAKEHIREGLRFSHDAIEGSLPHIIGHYHPKTSVPVRSRRVRGPCFAVTPHLLIMPAFGSYTGGLDVRHEAFQAVLGDATPTLYLMHRSGLYRLSYR